MWSVLFCWNLLRVIVVYVRTVERVLTLDFIWNFGCFIGVVRDWMDCGILFKTVSTVILELFVLLWTVSN